MKIRLILILLLLGGISSCNVVPDHIGFAYVVHLEKALGFEIEHDFEMEAEQLALPFPSNVSWSSLQQPNSLDTAQIAILRECHKDHATTSVNRLLKSRSILLQQELLPGCLIV